MKVRGRTIAIAVAGMALLATQPLQAGWKRIEVRSVEVGKGGMMVQPVSEWNRSSRRPSSRGESWTKDGFQLNRLDFFTQIEPGESIYKERSRKRRPLPKFRADMLLPDLAELFEANFSIENDVTLFQVTRAEPALLGGAQGIRIEYEFAFPNDPLRRRGEARLGVSGGKLYVINYAAPTLYYFDASKAEVQRIMESAQLR
jgi:hypothetical protein